MKDNSLQIWRLLYKNILLIVLVTIIFGVCFGAFFYLREKPVYTATKSVLVSADIDPDSSSEKASNYALNNASLAEILLPSIESRINSTMVNSMMNLAYASDGNEGSIGGISMSYRKDSLIFSMSYSDTSKELATKKLDFVLDNIEDIFDELERNDIKVFSAGRVYIRSVQNNANISTSTISVFKVVAGFFIGLLIALTYVVVVYFLDNKVKTEEEIRAITGEDVLSYLEK